MATTTTRTYTRTNTSVYLAEIIMGTIADLLADLGIDVTDLYREWKQDESAIKEWIEEESLKEVVLECHQPEGLVSPIIEFPVSYSADVVADAKFTAHRAALARYRAKLSRVPRGTTFRLFCTFRKQHSSQPGWGPGTRESTEGLRSVTFGALATGPHGSVSMRYHH